MLEAEPQVPVRRQMPVSDLPGAGRYHTSVMSLPLRFWCAPHVHKPSPVICLLKVHFTLIVNILAKLSFLQGSLSRKESISLSGQESKLSSTVVPAWGEPEWSSQKSRVLPYHCYPVWCMHACHDFTRPRQCPRQGPQGPESSTMSCGWFKSIALKCLLIYRLLVLPSQITESFVRLSCYPGEL